MVTAALRDHPYSRLYHLAEHPTTGYRWQVAHAAGLVLTGDDFTVSSSAPGTGGERVFRFAVQQSGAYGAQTQHTPMAPIGIPQAPVSEVTEHPGVAGPAI